MTGSGGTGQLSGHCTTLVAIGVALSGSSGDVTPPLSHAVTSARAASATAMSSALILDVKRAPLPTGRPKALEPDLGRTQYAAGRRDPTGHHISLREHVVS